MKWDKILKRVAIVLLIICGIVLAIDVIKLLKININFINMQSSTRIPNSSDTPQIKYEPTDYIIKNKAEVIEEVKRIANDFNMKNDSDKETDIDEIANIYKLENYFYDYKSYLIVKHKLLNVVDKIPDLYKTVKGYSDDELEKYFNDNKNDIEYYYGITDFDEFSVFVKSLSFMGNKKVELMMIQSDTIDFNYESDKLKFMVKIKSENGKSNIYGVQVQYFKTTDNQINPYMKIYFDN